MSSIDASEPSFAGKPSQSASDHVVGAETLTIRRPDDWHIHLREGDMLQAVLPFSARVFGRFVAMPNTIEPITHRERARQYRAEIVAATPKGCVGVPMIPCYLTDTTPIDEVIEGHLRGDFFGAKYYPVGATTQSHAGVTDIRKLYPVFEAMQKHSVPLMMHGEVVDPDTDIYDRERVFVERTLSDLVRHFPALPMTMEHLTTSEAVDFVAENAPHSRLSGSITLHHMLLTRNDMLNDGMRSDFFCYPLCKTARDCRAVRQAAVSGRECYFLGTDSAPHPLGQKYAAIAKAGIFSAPYALGGYAAVFAAEGRLDNLENFASVFGARHYGLPLNSDSIVLQQHDEQTDEDFLKTDKEEQVKIFRHPSSWRVVDTGTKASLVQD